MEQLAQINWERILPRVKKLFPKKELKSVHGWEAFSKRLERIWPVFFKNYYRLYHHHYDFFYHLEQLVLTVAQSWIERDTVLKDLDVAREQNPSWYLSENMVGGVLYVDLFSENLEQLNNHISYFKKLGLTYLHLMPLFAVPHGENDGGYAVSNYRVVNPQIGTMAQLKELTFRLKEEGISLALDFVFNHTSNDHEWALKAKQGLERYKQYYYIYPDRQIPDQYEQNLREIFPTIKKGSFSWDNEAKGWVWTTFNAYQWDLNYANPEVFQAMMEEMFYLANTGVEILRLDAVPFIWKKMGTNCENLEEAHILIETYNLIARVAAPALLFKSEAIVHPDEVIRYISPDKCQLSYNPMLMALLWEMIATRKSTLINYALQNRHKIPGGCNWVNYLRCHDDIGWTFDDNDAWSVGINPQAHRQFLNKFYTGQFEGSFARGVPFQFNPATGDLRISGTLASLAGLEEGIKENDPQLIENAVRRITLLRALVLSMGGIPLLYLGDEWGALNDYSFISDPAKALDSRWIHRFKKKWTDNQESDDPESIEWRLYNDMLRLIQLRKNEPALSGSQLEIMNTQNEHLFAYVRSNGAERLLCIYNISDEPQQLHENIVRLSGMGYHFYDLLTQNKHDMIQSLTIEPLQFLWLKRVQDL